MLLLFYCSMAYNTYASLLVDSDQENYDEEFPDTSLAIENSLRDDNQPRYHIIMHYPVVGSLTFTFLNIQSLKLVFTYFMESGIIFQSAIVTFMLSTLLQFLALNAIKLIKQKLGHSVYI